MLAAAWRKRYGSVEGTGNNTPGSLPQSPDTVSSWQGNTAGDKGKGTTCVPGGRAEEKMKGFGSGTEWNTCILITSLILNLT